MTHGWAPQEKFAHSAVLEGRHFCINSEYYRNTINNVYVYKTSPTNDGYRDSINNINVTMPNLQTVVSTADFLVISGVSVVSSRNSTRGM